MAEEIQKPVDDSDFSQPLFQELCETQCTLDEICKVMRLSELELRMVVEKSYADLFKEPSFDAVFGKFRARGLTRLRKVQFNHAVNNATMAIHLGRVYLNQKDKSDGNENELRELTDLLSVASNTSKDLVSKLG